MVADNCRLSCQLDTLVLLTNRSAKLIRKCCKSGNYGYHFSLGAINQRRMKNIISVIILLFLIPIISFGQSEYKRTIYFANNSSTLDQKSLKSIDSLVSICSSQTDFSIALFGHTDDIGSNEFNKELSDRRVSAVMDYFTTRNITADKVNTESFGETKPFTSNDSENNRAKNRRVEIILTVQKSEPKVIIPESNKDTLGWPGDNAILVSAGTRNYRVPGTLKNQVEISVITTTSEMEAQNISTLTTEDSALTSNIMICIRGPVGSAPCDLPNPIRIYIPASTTPFCKVPDVKFYDSDKDSIGSGMIKWKEILPSYSTESYNGESFFVITIRSLCNNPCKNFDCPKLRTAKANIKLKNRKFKISTIHVIHEQANALLLGKELSKNHWQIEYFNFENVDIPIIKLVISKRKKTYIKKIKLSDIEKDNEGNYLVTKKQIKAG